MMFDRLVQAVLNEEVGHVPVQLEEIPSARVLYRSEGDVNALASTSHAWRLARPEGVAVSGKTAAGLADRYGGSGIGRNGGSGRNAVIGQVQIKGVGRTTLVSPETPASHASGGAYLEECIREAIFSGVVAHDFPYGAVPVHEIVDTGECQWWPAPIQPAQERRVLLVRPLFVRPAHFERALGFDLPRRQQAREDHDRVAAVLERSASILGADAFVALLDSFWPKWAHQLAYGFVHRLSHGNDTSSNISVDGRLLDFGAASALPSWANTASSYFHDPVATRFDCIAQAIRSTSYYIGRHLGWHLQRPADVEGKIERCAEAFRRALVFEVLRLAGLPDPMAFDVVTGPRREAAVVAVRAAIEDAQRVRLDLLEPAPLECVDWPMAKLWEREPPDSLRLLRRFLQPLIGRALREDCQQTHARLSRTRSELFKPHLRQSIFQAIDRENDGRLGATASFVQAFVDGHVARSRREQAPAAADPMRVIPSFGGSAR